MINKGWAEKAKELRAQGMSYAKIAAIVGVSASTASRTLDPEIKAKHLAGNRAYYGANKDKGKAYRKANKERIMKVQKAYRQANKEKIAVKDATYRQTNKEMLRAKDATYRKANKGRMAAYRQANKEKIAVQARAYRQANKEVLAQYIRNYRKLHSVEDNVYCSKRRALIAGVAIGNLIEIKEIYRRAREDAKVRCYLCGTLIPIDQRHVDHIIPVSKGGVHRPSNLAVACGKCNLTKYNKLPWEIGLLL